MDAKDIKILNIMRTDGRIPSKELSQQIELSEAATHVRLQNLLKREIITEVNSKINYSFMDLNFEALVIFKILPEEHFNLIEEVEKKHQGALTWYLLNPRQLALGSLQTAMAVMVFKSEKHLLNLMYELVSKSQIITGIEYYEVIEESSGTFTIP